MRDKFGRSWLLPIVLIANAAGVLLFRSFLTLDGPMHVLHACALKSTWFSHRYSTPQVDYLVNPGTLDLFDLVLVPLTVLFSPLTAHAVYGAIVLLALAVGALSIAHAAGCGDRPLLVWVMPLSFSFIFIMGFMTFLLATGLALFTAGWWMRQEKVTVRRVLIACALIIACQATHRVGGSLALLLFGCFELSVAFHDRQAWKARWAVFPIAVRNVLLTMAVAAAGYKVVSTVLMRPRVVVEANPEFWSGLFRLRPLLLFEEASESPLLLGLGLLLIGSAIAALYHRFTRGAGSPISDSFLLAAILLFVMSVVARTPNAELLYISVRSQTIALFLLAIWTAAVIPRSVFSITLAVLILGVHVWRTVRIEERMAGSRSRIDQALEVVERLPVHGVALPVVLDDNWMHEHLSAFVAARYEGIFFSPVDHLGFRHQENETWQLRDYSDGFQQELRWLDAHVANNHPPIIDHIVLFGQGRPMNPRLQNLIAVRDRYYFLQWRNDYAEIWVRDTLR